MSAQGGRHVAEDGRVEVDPAQPFDALRSAQDLESAGSLAQNGGVERPAAEIVDRDDRSGFDPGLARVVNGRGFGLGDTAGPFDTGQLHRLVE